MSQPTQTETKRRFSRWQMALLLLMMLAFLAYQELFATRTSALVDKAGELSLLRLQGERLADIMMTPPETDAPTAAPAALPGPGRISLKGLRFRYSDIPLCPIIS